MKVQPADGRVEPLARFTLILLPSLHARKRSLAHSRIITYSVQCRLFGGGSQSIFDGIDADDNNRSPCTPCKQQQVQHIAIEVQVCVPSACSRRHLGISLRKSVPNKFQGYICHASANRKTPREIGSQKRGPSFP